MYRRAAILLGFAAAWGQPADVLLKGGLVYDGTGGPPRRIDIAIRGDRLIPATSEARQTVDVTGSAVAPGFINMLSWATVSLLVDGRAQSDLRQGITLEVMGEGESMGPLNAAMRKELSAQGRKGELKYDVPWRTLGEYLTHLESRGIAVNVASFVGAATVRVHELGYANRRATPGELTRMQNLVQAAMREGAMGVASALIYAPGAYADNNELVALAKAASPFGGMYISHLRSEGDRFIEAIDEIIHIAREAGIRAEIYHLKAGGRDNWNKLPLAIERIEAARRSGLAVTADMYNYTAGATGLDAAMPPWVQEGGYEGWAKRLKDPAIRARVLAEMRAPAKGWENLMRAAGGQGTLLLSFQKQELKPLQGKTLAEVAKQRGKSVEETAIDLVLEDGSRVEVAYFLMSEENVRRQIQLPWISFCSDASAPTAHGPFLLSSQHPRAYGNFARLLGRYVRDEKLIPLEEAIRRLTSLPAGNLRIKERGYLKPGFFADVVVFDPASIRDHATFEKPHQYSTGVRHVFVNGRQVLKDGEPTGAKAGRFIRGPGYKLSR